MAHYTRYPAEPEWTEWIRPKMENYLLACCDCGLVHTMQFKIVKWGRRYKVLFRARRNKRSTGQVRRHMKPETAH